MPEPAGIRDFNSLVGEHARKDFPLLDADMTIAEALERIRRERSSGSDFLDLKTGTGGIIEAEFLVQALQMKANIWAPNWYRAIDALRKCGILSSTEISDAKRSHDFLRRCESVLRRWENKTVSTLPGAEHEQRKLAIRFGSRDFDAFRQGYVDARETIHALYQSRIKRAAHQSY